MPKTKQSALVRLLKVLSPWVFFFGMMFFTLQATHAQGYLGEGWDRYLQGVKTFAPTGKSGEELAISFILNVIHIVRNVIGGVALIMGVLYGLRLVISRGQEEVIKKQQNNFLYLVLGFVVLIIAENVARIFNPEHASTAQIIDFNATQDQLRDIVSYVKWLLGSICVLLMTISGLRLIAAQGEEDEIKTQKRNITWSFMGMLTILLASNIVNAVYVVKAPDETAAAAPQTGILALGSLVKLVLVFLGPAAIAFTLYAGFLYLTSLDKEEGSKQGKEMIIAGVVAIVIIYGAYAIVNTVTSAKLGYINPFIA